MSKVSLSEHRRGKAFAGFKKNIGRHTFYFGEQTSRAEATRQAIVLLGVWEEMKRNGVTVWTPEAIAAAKRKSLGVLPFAVAPTVAPIVPSPPNVIARPSLTFYEAFKKFCESARANPIYSPSWRSSLPAWVSPLKKVMADVPLVSIGFVELNDMAGRIVGKCLAGEISATYAKNQLVAARILFDWFSDSGLWTECPKLVKVWKKNRKAISRFLPRGEKIDAFNIAELTSLYASGTATERLFLLLGLFCGWTQVDIATSKVGMFDLKTGVVSRTRNKTGVEGRWIIPSQLVQLLTPHISGRGENDIAIVSDEGNPLLSYSPKGGRVDLIRDSWDRMQERSGVCRLSFKYLRKTGSQLIREIADLEVSQMFLAHSDGSVAGRSYNTRVLDKLQTALLEMHRRLSPMFGEKSPTRAMGSLR